MSTFVDTSALYAVLDADDERHTAAGAQWDRLLAGREALHTTNYVLVETTALLQSRIGMGETQRPGNGRERLRPAQQQVLRHTIRLLDGHPA